MKFGSAKTEQKSPTKKKKNIKKTKKIYKKKKKIEIHRNLTNLPIEMGNYLAILAVAVKAALEGNHKMQLVLAMRESL